MKDEIKEIVRRMNDLIEHQFDKEYHTKCNLFKDIQSLLDYITNLQEENKRLTNIIDELERFLKYEIYCDFNKEMTKGYQDTLDKLKELKGGE